MVANGPSRYAEFLSASAAALWPLEQALSKRQRSPNSFLTGTSAHGRPDDIHADLTELGVPCPVAAPAPALDGEAFLFGILYVLEGSRLGARLLTRQVLASRDPPHAPCDPPLPAARRGQAALADVPVPAGVINRSPARTGPRGGRRSRGVCTVRPADPRSTRMFGPLNSRLPMPDSTRIAVDLTNCDREPIHLIGSVQSFGLLLAVERCLADNARIPQRDGVAGPFAARPHRQAAARRVQRGGDPRHAHPAAWCDHGRHGRSPVRREIASGAPLCDLAVHVADDAIIIECEPSITEGSDNTGLMVRGMIARLQQTHDLRAFYRMAARELRAMTEFDRVMVYRFDQDGSGEVIAESARGDLESYLGLRYPASDIPQPGPCALRAQLAAPHCRRQRRAFADRAGAGPGGQPLDLSRSVLRSVSPIHVEYLRNMGVSRPCRYRSCATASCGACSPATIMRRTASPSAGARLPSCSARCSRF